MQSVVLRLHVICPSVCPFVRPSVTLVNQDHIGWKSWKLIAWTISPTNQDHIGWKSWKLIAWTISPTPSLFVAQRPSTYSQGNICKFWEIRGEVGKSGVLEHKSGYISEMRKDMDYGGFIGSCQCSFEQYHPQPTTASSSPRFRVLRPHPKLQSLLSQEQVKLQTSNFVGALIGSIGTKDH